MGNTQQTQLDQSYETQLVKKIQITNSVDHKNKILFGIFKTEYYNLRNKCTIIVKYIDDAKFRVVYNDFINKWNNGTTSGADFNFLSLYVSKVH